MIEFGDAVSIDVKSIFNIIAIFEK